MLCPIVTILFAVGSGIAKGKLFNSEKNRAATDPSVTVVVEQSDDELVAVAAYVTRNERASEQARARGNEEEEDDENAKTKAVQLCCSSNGKNEIIRKFAYDI
ncbi:hypothetical protein T08_13264 [Trichinella sp. T8]|nr:hypothetical protein T08_13264 [Trichinella sp. T8]